MGTYAGGAHDSMIDASDDLVFQDAPSCQMGTDCTDCGREVINGTCFDAPTCIYLLYYTGIIFVVVAHFLFYPTMLVVLSRLAIIP